MDIHNHVVDKHRTFALVEARACALKDAAFRLGLSYRQTKRWWKRYRTVCGSLIDFARSSPRGGGRNRLLGSVIQAVIDCKKTHLHRGVSHIADTVNEEEGTVSKSTVRRILHDADLLEKIRQPVRAHARFEVSAFGERLQMDTTSGAWMAGYRLIYLIAAIDDHSRMLLGWRWVDSDSAWNNMRVSALDLREIRPAPDLLHRQRLDVQDHPA